MDLNKYIWTTDQGLPLDSINAFERYCKNLKAFQDGVVDEGVLNEEIRKVKTHSLSRDSKSLADQHWFNFNMRYLIEHVGNYINDTGSYHCPAKRLLSMEILKYQDAGFYKPHVDHFDLEPRTLTMLLLINDDYEGGQLYFTNPDGTGETVIETKKNRLIVFPSTFLYPHAVKPVTKGIRYSLVLWTL